MRPETPPEGLLLPPAILARIRDPRSPLKARARAAGLTMQERERIPSTRRAHQTAEFARAHGGLERTHAALLRRYWAEGADLWSLDTLRGAVSEAGLDADALESAIAEGTYAEEVERRVREAGELGVRAVPTFLFDEKLALEGAHELPTFEQVMKRLGAEPRA